MIQDRRIDNDGKRLESSVLFQRATRRRLEPPNSLRSVLETTARLLGGWNICEEYSRKSSELFGIFLVY